jgi:hypothetical protein
MIRARKAKAEGLFQIKGEETSNAMCNITLAPGLGIK